MSRNYKNKFGFTLIEMLMVLALIGIITAITVPQFVNSMRGNRLRVAVRSVVMAGRYARSMAVMRQTDIVLSINIDDGLIIVEQVSVADAVETPDLDAVDDYDSEDSGIPVKVMKRTELLSRKLEDVAFVYVEIDDDTISAKTCSIVYSSNGRCTPYSVKVSDAQGKSVVVDVDALSSASTAE